MSTEINTRPSAYEEILDMAVNQPLINEIFTLGMGGQGLKIVVAWKSLQWKLKLQSLSLAWKTGG